MRQAAGTDQPTVIKMRDGAAPRPAANPDYGRELAVVAQQYKYLCERMDRQEHAIEEGLESIRRYLKDEYAQAIEHRVAMLSGRLDSAERQIAEMRQSVDSLTRKVLVSAGGIAVLVFLIQFSGTLISGALGG